MKIWNRFFNRSVELALAAGALGILVSTLKGWAYWYVLTFIGLYLATGFIDWLSILNEGKAKK